MSSASPRASTSVAADTAEAALAGPILFLIGKVAGLRADLPAAALTALAHETAAAAVHA